MWCRLGEWQESTGDLGVVGCLAQYQRCLKARLLLRLEQSWSKSECRAQFWNGSEHYFALRMLHNSTYRLVPLGHRPGRGCSALQQAPTVYNPPGRKRGGLVGEAGLADGPRPMAAVVLGRHCGRGAAGARRRAPAAVAPTASTTSRLRENRHRTHSGAFTISIAFDSNKHSSGSRTAAVPRKGSEASS